MSAASAPLPPFVPPPPLPPGPRVVLLMGVAGCGKTTVGRLLAGQLGGRFEDADDHHPPANIAKMSAGIPLDDRDRAPWLQRLAGRVRAALNPQSGEPGVFVLACSALRRAYREQLVIDRDRVHLVHLQGDWPTLWARLSARQGHYMKEGMLRSQFAVLEPPGPEERALVLDVGPPPEELVARIRAAFRL
jgi:gluconokinase